MLPAETLNIIHQRILQLFSSEESNHDKPFGALNVLLFGDLLQLKPEHGHWVFQQWSTSHLFFGQN